jgi:hypothetical protein
MATTTHEPLGTLPEKRRRFWRVVVPEMWASLAIAVMWFTVLLDALFGPDIVSANGAQLTRIPSAVVLALFAYLGTRVVARFGFGHTADSLRGPAEDAR